MQIYLDRIGPYVRSALEPGEVVIAATPATVPVINSKGGSPPSSARWGPVGSLALEQRTAPAGLPFAGRMILVMTDRRLIAFERRRFRMLPGRQLGSVRRASLGNVEGSIATMGGVADLELVVILNDGTAGSVRVPSGYVVDGREFVRRTQAHLLG